MSPKKKSGVAPELSAAAAVIGRMGGLAKSAKQQATRAKNGKHGGRPRQLPRGTTRILYHHMQNIAAQGGEIRTPKQQAAFDAVERLRKEQE